MSLSGGGTRILTRRPRYRPPGDAPRWAAVIGQRFLGILPPSAPAGLLGDLLALATGRQASAESVLGTIPIAGAHAIDSFAIVLLPPVDTVAPGPGPDWPVTVVVRGNAVVRAVVRGRDRKLEAGRVSPWVLADLRPVEAVTLGSAEGTRASLPVEAGVVPAGGVRWSAGALPVSPALIRDGTMAGILPKDR